MIFYVTIKHKEKQNKRVIIEALTLILTNQNKILIELIFVSEKSPTSISRG